MTQPSITVRAPATVANIGPGFDAMGFALAVPCVEVTVSWCGDDGALIVESDAKNLPTNVHDNTAAVAAQRVRAACGDTRGLRIAIRAGIPIGSGLGSSAASAVAAAVATNALFGAKLSSLELLACALSGEFVASGARHADNVAPALFGGIGIVRMHEPLDWIALQPACPLHCVVVHPAVEVRTAMARSILPETILLSEGVAQWAQVAALVAGICQGDTALIGRALHDPLIEPYRGTLIPGYAAVKQSAQNAGALGCAISGSGPAMFAFTSDAATAVRVQSAMQQAFRAAGVASQAWVSVVGAGGATVV